MTAGAAIFSLGAGLPRAAAALFPSRADGDDVMTGMGVFRVVVSPSFRFLMAPNVGLNGYPGYQLADGRLTSPLLFDTNTIVGRSDPYDRPLIGFRAVGLPSMGLQGIPDYPLIPPPFNGMPAGTRELLTRIRNLELRTSSQSCAQDPRVPFVPINHRMVSGGPDQGVLRSSIGMVQRRSDAPAGSDFPAQSFFDIFVEIDLPPAPMTMSAGTFPSGGAVLYNRAPLLLLNTNLESLPPQVIYAQGETMAVPLHFRDPNPPFWNADDTFGYLVLAGDGTGIDCTNAPAVRAFLDTVLGPIGGRPANELPIEWPFSSDRFPPTNSTYDSVKGADVIQFNILVPPPGLRVRARNFSLGRLDNPIMPPAEGASTTYRDAFIEVRLEYSTDDGATWFPAMSMGEALISIRNTSDMGGLRTFDTEMLGLDFVFTGPQPPIFRIRESPLRPSRGLHTIRDTGGDFLISSFFDVWFELSIDGGINWIPADRPIRVQLTPGCEMVAPTVVTVTADCDANTIRVQYSEPMDPVSTTDPGRYTLGASASVLSVALNASGDVATLRTTDLFCDKGYTLMIRNVRDKCDNVISPDPTSVDFVCPPCKVSKWSQLPGFLLSPPGVDPNRRGGDRPSDFDWVTLMESGTTATEPNWVIAEDFRSDGRPIVCVRWWGSYLPGYEPGGTTPGGIANTFFEDGYVLSFFTSTPPGGAPSRPLDLLGTYIVPLSAIKITPTRFIGCDSNRIWQYEVKLEDTCLEHADPSIATPRAFLEVSNVVYWLAITAEVGHRVVPLFDSAGNVAKWEEELTGKRAKEHFWGWHTSPRHALNPSSMGHVFMQGEEWIYPTALWMSNFQQPLCDDIAQAFELLTMQPPCETNPPAIISVAADCENDKITVTYSEAMEPTTVGDPGHYALTGATINSIVLNADASLACLYTDDLKCDATYTLTVRDVADVCRNAILPASQNFTLACPPCPKPKVAKWTQLPGFLLTTTGAGGNFRGANRPSDFDWTALMQSGTTLANPNWVIAEDFRSDGRPIVCVRWWGSYMRGFEPTSATLTAATPPDFFEDGYVLSFFTDVDPVGPGASSRPGQLLGSYLAPLSSIKITPTQFIGCDSNRIWQYEVRLEDTCLDHADPRLARPDAFLEVSNVVYWLAITAEVGHEVIRITDAAGNLDWRHQPNGKRADRHFWGWHTSPSQREDRSVMGHVFMQNTDWIYPPNLWMPNPVVCQEIDQAFQLLTSEQPPCETNPPTVISVSANCDSNRITVVYNEAMDPVTAGNPGNYSVSGGVMIMSVTLNAVGDTASLLTTDLACGHTYAVVVRGVRDLCDNLIVPNPSTNVFTCPPCSEPKTAKWSQLPAYLISTANPHRRGADRPSDFDWNLIMNDVILQPNWITADDFLSDGRPILCVRWWGSYFQGYEPVTTGAAGPQFFEDGYVLSFFTGFIGGISRPEKLLATYVAPLESVKIMPTPFFGCDSNRIYQYEVALKDTCLDHSFTSIARPSAFLEQTNEYYFLAISAEVGHRITPLRNSQGQIVDWVQKPTDKRAQEHFWGWHTSPSNHLDVSVMGNVLMEGQTWNYTRWGRNEPVCDEIDQAFELLTGPITCPPPATLNIVRSGDNVVISWVGDFTLQGTPALADPSVETEWTDLTTSSPAILPIILTQHRFFRLICP